MYVIEANITFHNGLILPLMTEFLYRENNQLQQADSKQDNESTAFNRMVKRIKKYFPQQKMIFFMDAMYASFPIMKLLRENHCEFIISLPKKKFPRFAKLLNQEKKYGVSISGKEYYRKRHQTFYGANNLVDDEGYSLKLHVVGCSEKYEKVDRLSGEIKKHYSERVWFSSKLILCENLHELINLGVRKKELMEDSINTEKNRGYRYKHAFSYDFNAMQGFHYLMRMGHLINALSEFSKVLKRYVKNLGASATLKLIKETLFGPWMSLEWYALQGLRKPQLRLQLE